jgi:DNA-binding MarR family transcriptional regulator
LPESRLPMRKAREILRLHFESDLVPGQIASICKVSRSTVQRCLERLKAAGLSWPLPAELDAFVQRLMSCARAMTRAPTALAINLDELEARAVCHVIRNGGSQLVLEIRDRFWPYQRLT